MMLPSGIACKRQKKEIKLYISDTQNISLLYHYIPFQSARASYSLSFEW